MFAGVAWAALTVLSVPAAAVTEVAAPASFDPAVDQAASAFYASRSGLPLWFRAGADSSAARALIDALQRASLDGFPGGPALAAQAQLLIIRAQAGDPAALTAADRTLSTAWVQYVEALQTPPDGMTYADAWVRPRRDSPATILARAAAAPSLAAYVRNISAVNPIYAQLRESAWAAMRANGGQVDPRIVASLGRARDIPPQVRYV